MHYNCQNAFWTLKKCFFTFVFFGNTKRKLGQNVFFTGNVAAFSLNCCSYLPGRSWRNDFKTCRKIFKIPCGPFLLCVNWGEPYSIRGEKISLKLFSTGRLVFFQEVVFPTTSWVLKDWCYNVYQKRQRTFSNLKKTIQSLPMSATSKKRRQNLFFSKGRKPFFEKLGFIDF